MLVSDAVATSRVGKRVDKGGASLTIFSCPVEDHADFQWLIDHGTFTGNGQTVGDPVVKWGWNINRSSDAAKADLHIALEQDYWTNVGFDGAWHHQSEAHIEWTGPNGNTRRVFSSSQAWHTNQVDTQLIGDWFNVVGSDGTQILNWSPNADAFLHKNFNINSPNAAVSLGDGTGVPILYLNSSNAGRIVWQVAGATQWDVYSVAGWLKIEDAAGRAPITFVSGATALTGRMELLSVFKFNDANLFQTTVGAAGAASALPVFPTKYLKVLDNGGTTYVIPCYAAA